MTVSSHFAFSTSLRGSVIAGALIVASACAPVRPALLPPAPPQSEETLVEARNEVVAAHNACTEEYVANQLPWQIWATSGAGAASVGLVGGATAVAFLSDDPVITGISVVGLSVLAVGSAGAAAYFAKDLRPRFERAGVQKSLLAISNDRANDAIARKDPLALRMTAVQLDEDCRATEAAKSGRNAVVLLDELRTYRAQVADREVIADRRQEEIAFERKKKEAAERERERLERKLNQMGASAEETQAKMATLEGRAAEKEAALARSLARVAELEEAQAELSAEQRKLLEEKRALEQKTSHFEDVQNALRAQISNKRLALRRLRNGVVVEMQNNVLFPSGSAELNDIGKETLAAVAEAIKNIKDRRIRVEGHTDNVPVGKNSTYLDNWELSSERSLTVTRYLQDNGVDPSTLSAEARAQYAPVASNRTRRGKAKNRRIEIYLVEKPMGRSDAWKPEDATAAPNSSGDTK